MTDPQRSIVVAYKWAADPQEATVAADGRVDFSRATAVVSDYDAVAIAVGRRLADDLGAVLVGVTVGGPDAARPKATKAALARGLDRVVVVEAPVPPTTGTALIARAVAAMVREETGVAAVLTGDSSVDLGAKTVPTVIGGVLGWPTLTDATGVDPLDGGLRVERTTPEGRQRIRIEGPAVVAVATDAATPRAPGMKDVLAAGKKPAVVRAGGDLGLAPGAAVTVRATRRLSGPERRGIRIAAEDPASAAVALVAALRSDGLLEGAHR